MLKGIYKFVTPWAKANKLQKFKNRIMGRIVNFIYPIYCKLFSIKNKTTKDSQLNYPRVVVSLTTYPARVNSVYLCINTVLRQRYKADRVVLWLSKNQFPNEDVSLPKRLLNLKRFGLEIKYVDGDLRSYKKIFYVAQEEQDSIIITCDDDTLYPEDWIEKLVNKYEKNLNCVVCYRAHLITFSPLGEINQYTKWGSLSVDFAGPSFLLVPIGVGGVLYPPKFFNNVVFDEKLIQNICPTTDDLWLKANGLLNGYKAVKVNLNSTEWFTIKETQKTSLMSVNVESSVNDLTFEKLLETYNIKVDKNMDYLK